MTARLGLAWPHYSPQPECSESPPEGRPQTPALEASDHRGRGRVSGRIIKAQLVRSLEAESGLSSFLSFRSITHCSLFKHMLQHRASDFKRYNYLALTWADKQSNRSDDAHAANETASGKRNTDFSVARMIK